MGAFTASARPIDGTLRHDVEVNGRHTITTDEPRELGGGDTAPTPHELLPAIVASCASTMITLYARRHGWALDGLSVDVEYEADRTPRRLAIHLRLPADLSSEQVDRLRRVAETCPVRRAFEAGFEFDEEIVVGSSGRGSAAAAPRDRAREGRCDGPATDRRLAGRRSRVAADRQRR
jgi:putative redox protein